jgi:hypothetical protein
MKEKTIKVKILKNKPGKASIITERNCTIEGGFRALTLKTI